MIFVRTKALDGVLHNINTWQGALRGTDVMSATTVLGDGRYVSHQAFVLCAFHGRTTEYLAVVVDGQCLP